MSTLEAVHVAVDPLVFDDCDTVGHAMVKIAMQHDLVATRIIIMDPTDGRKMDISEAVFPRVEFAIRKEDDAKENIESWQVDLRLHAEQSDYATCKRLLYAPSTLSNRRRKRRAKGVLGYVLTRKERKWREAATTMMHLGVNGARALFLTARIGCVQSVEMLLSSADLGTSRGTNLTRALMNASIGGHAEVAKMLLSAGADAKSKVKGYGDSTTLIEACRLGRISVVEALLSAGADANERCVGDNMVRKGCETTALIEASRLGHVGVVKVLLLADADAQAKGYGDTTALIIASRQGHARVVEALLSAGTDVNANGLYGTALIEASRQGRSDVAQVLLSAGADSNTKASCGSTAVEVASRQGHEHVVDILSAHAKGNSSVADKNHREI